jgi:putative membrane protein
MNAIKHVALAIMISGLIYEWLEWGVALTMSPEAAEAYNGQQGDIWDAHMDMLLATIGALLTWPWLRGRTPRDFAVSNAAHHG